MKNQDSYNYEIVRNKFGEPLTPYKEDLGAERIKERVNGIISNANFRLVQMGLKPLIQGDYFDKFNK